MALGTGRGQRLSLLAALPGFLPRILPPCGSSLGPDAGLVGKAVLSPGLCS